MGTLVKTLFELLPHGSYTPPYTVVVFLYGFFAGVVNNWEVLTVRGPRSPCVAIAVAGP